MLLAALFVMPFSVFALENAPAPPGGTYVTSFSPSLDLYDPFYQQNNSFSDGWLTIVWAIPGGGTALSFSAASIDISDSTTLINGMDTPVVFDLLAYASVEKAVALGHLPAASNPLQPKYTTVLFPSCVARSGSGGSTMFSICGSGAVSVAYRYYTVAGVPVITKLGSTSNGCSESGCDETVETGGRIR